MNNYSHVSINSLKYPLHIDFFKKSINIIDFCLNNGFVIPRFCYHSKLAIAGNCRMCLIEVRQIL
jgi:NADH dehydrogenase/NADH:ubiquinone oxidoreductase subunit G